MTEQNENSVQSCRLSKKCQIFRVVSLFNRHQQVSSGPDMDQHVKNYQPTLVVLL